MVFYKTGRGYRTQLAGEVVSNDGRQLTIKGQVTNPKGQNGTYVVKYHTGLTVYDSARNEINFSDLQPGSPISVYYHWNIPKYVSPRTDLMNYLPWKKASKYLMYQQLPFLGMTNQQNQSTFLIPTLQPPD